METTIMLQYVHFSFDLAPLLLLALLLLSLFVVSCNGSGKSLKNLKMK